MATSYSSYVSIGGYSVRLRFMASVSSTSSTSATVSWRLDIVAGSGGGSASGSDPWSVERSGASTLSGTKSWNLSGGSDSYLIASGTQSVSRSYSGSSWTGTGAMSQIGPTDSGRSASVTLSIPRRTYDAPAAPTEFTAAYVNDSRIDLSWGTSPTTAAPVTKAEVRRRGTSFVTIAMITSGGLTSYSDRGTRADRAYEYAVRVGNADGWSGFTYLPSTARPVFTTPATPGRPSVTKLSSGDIRVSRPSISDATAQWRVWHILDGVLQSTPEATVSAGTSSWILANPDPAKTHAFSVSAVSPRRPSGELESNLGAASSTLQLQAPPIGPTIVGPDVTDGDEATSLEWVHNPADSSEQRQFELRRRPGSSFAWTSTGEVTSSDSSWTLPAGTYPNGGQFEWQVRTWGAHATASPWSETAVTALSSRPVAGIISPEATHSSARVVVNFSYSDPEASPMVRAQVRLWRENLLLETKTVYAGMLPVAYMSTRLDDQTTYRATARVLDGAGLWSADAEQVFFVEYAPPPTPTLVATWDADSGHTVLTVGSPAPVGDEQDVDSIRVERADVDHWVVVGAGLQPGETVTDPIPPLGRPVTYRAVATSVLESTAYSPDAVVQTDSRWVFINYGPSLHSVARLRGNVQVSRSYRRKKSVQHYSGRALPVARAGRELTETYDLSGALIAPHLPQVGSSGWDEFVEMEDAAAPVCVRDPEGVRLFCAVAGFDVSGYGSPIRQVQMQFTRVDWSEEQA